MFCQNCGKKQTEGAVYCYSCGNKLEDDIEQNLQVNPEVYNPNPVAANPVKCSKFALIGFIFSLIPISIFMFIGINISMDSLALFYSLIVLPCSVLGIVFSSIGLKHTSMKKHGGRGFAIAGLIVAIAILSISTFSLSLIPY